MLAAFQRFTFEACADLPPLVAGMSAGFLVVIGGQTFLTQAGYDYLEALDNHPDMRDQTYDQSETPVVQAAA